MNSRFNFRVLVLAVALPIVLSASSRCSADTLFSNLAEPLKSATPIADPATSPLPPEIAVYWAAQSFIVGSTPFTVTSFEIIAGESIGSLSAFAELRKADAPGIFGEIDFSAGGLVDTLTVPDLTGANGVRSFSLSGPVALDPSTKYWLVIGNSTGAFEWGYALGNGQTGPGTIFNYADSDDVGATWIYRSNDDPYFIQATGFFPSVPEPTGALLAGGGLLGMLVMSRHRRIRPKSMKTA